VALHPALRWWVIRTGFWVTGVDPKGWTMLHRMHHRHSDTALDPHQPGEKDPFSIVGGTMAAYLRYLRRAEAGDPELNRISADIPLGMPYWFHRHFFYMPVVLWLVCAGLFGWATGAWGLALGLLAGLDFFFKTYVANGLGHSVGYRNHDTPDDSTNNRWAVWLVGGENLHNNHHRYPSRANFAHMPGELDPAFAMARLLQAVGLLCIKPHPSDATVGAKAS
jgi:fatty-acid desaturase